MNDHETAEALYKQALATARREGPNYLATIHKEYGIYLFDIGKYENASSQLEEAIALISLKGGDRSLQRRFQYPGMRAVQHARHGYRLDDADAFLRDAQAAIQEVHEEDFREEMREDLRDYRRQIDAARQRVGKRQGGREIQ
jgi:Tfp pilus assembly protein PilF